MLAAGSGPASIYAADKLARVRPTVSPAGPSPCAGSSTTGTRSSCSPSRRPELPFLEELARELPELEPEPEQPA